MDFFKKLPPCVLQLIYSYDNTYKEIFTIILKRYLPRKKVISPHQARKKGICVIESICTFGKEIGRDMTKRTAWTMILNEDKHKLKNLGNHRITHNIFRYIVRQFGRDIVIEEYSHPMYHNKKSALREYILGERSWWKEIQRRYNGEYPRDYDLPNWQAKLMARKHCCRMRRWFRYDKSPEKPFRLKFRRDIIFK